jgi:DNA-directed RNA polymerase subunit RPC12/RpoP
VNDEKPEDVQYFVKCTYCGTQTQLSFNELHSDKPLKCRTCGAPFKVVPPPKKPVKKREKPFSDYDAVPAERHAYERRTEGGFKKARYVGGIIIGALLTTIWILLMVLDSC